MPHFDFDIFFSFASLDKAEARPLYEQLTASGLRVFWSDESLQESIGESWYNEIAEALQSSRHFVLLWTEASAKSKFVELEYSRFHASTIQEQDRYLVPVLGRGVHPGTLPFLLGNFQCFSLEKDLSTLVEKLGGNVEGYANQEISYATAEEPPPASAAPNEMNDEHGIEFVLIQPGTFIMGDDSISQAKPAHEVTLTRPFYMGKYPVTQEQWTAQMGSNNSRYPGAKNPVEQVSWDDVQSFLAKLGPGYRLPTEAEWEYACRAGTTTAYSFGDHKEQLDAYAWHRQNAGDTHHPVGQKQPNPWGLYDMHGNVYEWVGDRYGGYESGSATDPTGPIPGDKRVIRGGSWSHFFKDLQSAARDGMRASSKYGYLGFRVVKEV